MSVWLSNEVCIFVQFLFVLLVDPLLAWHGELKDVHLLCFPIHQHHVRPQVGDGDVGGNGAAAGHLVPGQVAVDAHLVGVNGGEDVR